MTHKIQIDDEVRDATPEEVAQIESAQAAVVAQAKTDAEKATAKAALLERLGISADESALLLG